MALSATQIVCRECLDVYPAYYITSSGSCWDCAGPVKVTICQRPGIQPRTTSKTNDRRAKDRADLTRRHA